MFSRTWIARAGGRDAAYAEDGMGGRGFYFLGGFQDTRDDKRGLGKAKRLSASEKREKYDARVRENDRKNLMEEVSWEGGLGSVRLPTSINGLLSSRFVI